MMDLTKRDKESAAEFARRFEGLIRHWQKGTGNTAADAKTMASYALGIATYALRYANHHRPSRVIGELVDVLQSGQVYAQEGSIPIHLNSRRN